MQEQIISFETAVLAKEKGFPQLNQGVYFTKEKEHCLVGWGFNDRTDNSLAQYSAPTQSLLQKWLREVHEIIIYVIPSYIEDESLVYKCNGFDNYIQVQRQTYEEALEIGLQEALKLIKTV